MQSWIQCMTCITHLPCRSVIKQLYFLALLWLPCLLLLQGIQFLPSAVSIGLYIPDGLPVGLSCLLSIGAILLWKANYSSVWMIWMWLVQCSSTAPGSFPLAKSELVCRLGWHAMIRRWSHDLWPLTYWSCSRKRSHIIRNGTCDAWTSKNWLISPCYQFMKSIMLILGSISLFPHILAITTATL